VVGGGILKALDGFDEVDAIHQLYEPDGIAAGAASVAINGAWDLLVSAFTDTEKPRSRSLLGVR
jgi:hypothetical protein